MKKRLSAVALFVAVAAFASVSFAGEMDLMLRGIVKKAKDPGALKASLSKSVVVDGEQALIPCFVKSDDVHVTAEAIEAAGGRAVIITDRIISAYLPPEHAERIAGRPEVILAEASPRLSPKMDSARTPTSVVAVQENTAGLGTAYNGTNVVVGVVDASLDYGNADFLNSDGSSTRIQYVQDKSNTSNLECYKKTINDVSCAITDGGQGGTHGTHVTGIASGSNTTYTGVAPEADIMFVFLNANDGDSSGDFGTRVAEGVKQLFDNADSIDKAAVVNLSLGTSLGAHDGTSSLEEALTDMSSASKGGRIIINAAGNEQTNPNGFSDAAEAAVSGGLHAEINAAAGASQGFRVGVWAGASSFSATGVGTIVDIWLDEGTKDSCSVAAMGYTAGRVAIDPTAAGSLDTANATFKTGDVSFATSTTDPVAADDGSVEAAIALVSAETANNKPHAQVAFGPAGGGSGAALETRWFDVIIRANPGSTACTGHMWLYFDSIGYHDFTKNLGSVLLAGADGYTLSDGDDKYTTTIPATAAGVIAVGSYMPPKPVGATTSKWTGNDGVTYNQTDFTGTITDDLSSFSSLGPTADGRTKPDIVAPGEPIIATKASGATVSNALSVGTNHMKMEGTSMASPFVSGIVALLLERNNTLSLGEVRTALQAGADTTGLIARWGDAANSYGAGKVDAAAILASVGTDTSSYSGTGDLEPSSGGGSSCAFIGNLPVSGGALSFFLVSSSVAAIFVLRRSSKRKS